MNNESMLRKKHKLKVFKNSKKIFKLQLTRITVVFKVKNLRICGSMKSIFLGL